MDAGTVVSEAIKTGLFLFLSQTGSYDAPDPERRLEAEVQRLEHEAGDLQRYTQRVQAKDRPLPAVHDVASYLELRMRQSQLTVITSRKRSTRIRQGALPIRMTMLN